MRLFSFTRPGWFLALAGISALAQEIPRPAAPAPLVFSPVIWVEHPEAVQRFAVNGDEVRSMLNQSLCKLTSAPDVGTAWKRLGITPQDVVGIKITTAGGPLLSTHRPLIQAIVSGLQEAGLTPDRMIIWDAFQSDMLIAGYTLGNNDSDHPLVASNFPGTGYDPDKTYKNEILGTLIWGDTDFVHSSSDGTIDDIVNKNPFGGGSSSETETKHQQTSTISYFARLETKVCTKIINVPVLTDNINVGLNGCLASLALASVDNNRRFQGSPTFGDPAIAEILDHDFIRRKVVIHILDALVAQYAGGPSFNPQFCEQIGALYVSRDPVAIDSLVLPRLEHWRAGNHVDPIGKTASHIHTGAYFNLGTDDPRRIQLIHLP